MIEKLSIHNFKSLQEISLELGRLNLFLGLNSMGKSSVIQSLLLLRQSYFKNSNLNTLCINGELISLGGAKDIYYQNADMNGEISFAVRDTASDIEAKYRYEDGTDILYESEISVIGAKLPEVSLFNSGFYYIAADHIAPSKTYNISNAGRNVYNRLGRNGENAPYYLARHGAESLKNKALHHDNSKSDTLAHELDAWMGEISPGTRILSEELPGIDLVKMSVQFKTRNKIAPGQYTEEYTEKYSPVNVGFGIPYVFPLLLILLISNPGDLVMIENPESHLHPRGQSELGRLMALAAQSGVQIICETHSDHVINGIRVAVKNQYVSNRDVRLFYFDKNRDTMLETEVTPIHVDRNGELDRYPQGLLDEWGNLMEQLI